MENERQFAIVDFEGLATIDERLVRVMKARGELEAALRDLGITRIGFTIQFKQQKEEPVSGSLRQCGRRCDAVAPLDAQ